MPNFGNAFDIKKEAEDQPMRIEDYGWVEAPEWQTTSIDEMLDVNDLLNLIDTNPISSPVLKDEFNHNTSQLGLPDYNRSQDVKPTNWLHQLQNNPDIELLGNLNHVEQQGALDYGLQFISGNEDDNNYMGFGVYFSLCSGVTMSWPSGTLPPLFSDDNPHQQRQESSHIRQQNAGKETLGLDLGCLPSQKKKRKLRSNVWEHFHKSTDKDGNDRARCNICDKDFDGSSKKGTTHLRNHFKSCQKRRNGAGDKPAEAGNSMNPIAIKEKSVMDQQLDNLDLTRMIVKYGVALLDSTQELDAYNEERKKLRKYFEKLSCHFCLTIDKVLLRKGYYDCITVNFIDDDWKLKRNIISFIRCTRDDQIASKCLEKVLLEWEIDDNVLSMVKSYDYSDMWDLIRENRFIGQGSLLFNRELLCIDSLEDISDSCHFFLSNIKWILYGCMSKIFNYITETSSKNETFRIAKDRAKSLGKEVTAEVIPTKQQLEVMTPQWNHENDSIVVLLEIALGFKEAFFEFENMDPDFKSINLTKEQWDHIRDIYKCYEDLTDESFLKHWSSYKTANMYFPMLCSLYKKALVWLKKQRIGLYWFENQCFIFAECMDRNWCRSNLVLAVAAVLDPRFKMDVVKYWYKKIYGSECETQLTTFTDHFTGVYNEYAKGTNDEKISSISYKMLDPSGKPGKSSHDLDPVRSLNFELHLYLEGVKFPLIEDFDILEWWRVNTQFFPTLARMARDFLAVQISGLSKDELTEIACLAKDLVSNEDEEAESES